jgi:serine/threonine protein kinase
MTADDEDLPREIPPEGVVIEGFPITLLKLLGRGGQGYVYLGHHRVQDRLVVVKFPDISPDAPHAIEDFKREVQALTRLNCESIVTIYEVGVMPTRRFTGRPYFTMEYLDNGSLRQRLRGEPFPVRRALAIAMEIADALTAAHAAGIVHRDLKPHNVLFNRTGRSKLIDFGLAKLINESKSHTAGYIRGTPKYMSPEQAARDVAGPKSDLYALGVMLFEMLTGRAPFEGTEYDMTLHHVMTPAPSLRDVGRGGPFPPELEGIMRSLLAKNPHERPQSAGELRRLLDGIRRLVPEEQQHRADDVDATDPTLSAAPTVQRNFDVAIAATRAPIASSERVYRTDAPTVDARVDGTVDAGERTSNESRGRTGVVAAPVFGAAEADDDEAYTRRERPLPLVVARKPQRRSGALVIAAIVAVFAGGAFAGWLALARTRGSETTNTPTAAVTPTATTPASTTTTSPPTIEPPPIHTTQPTSASAPAATSPAVAAAPAKPGVAAKAPPSLPMKPSAAPTTASPPPPPPATTQPTPTTAPAPTKSPIDDRF